MKQLLQYIFSITLVMFACQAHSQGTTDTTKVIRVESGLTLYVDYGKLLTLPSNFETKAEAGISYVMKNRFSPNIQVGMAILEPSGAFENGVYKAEGMYARVGIDYLIPFDPVNTLYIGAKYAQARFEENGSYEIGSNLWPDKTENYSRGELEAAWYEVIIGSEKKFTKQSDSESIMTNWSIGGYFSLRVMNSREEFDPIDTYAIPGYGRAFDNTAPAVNVYIRYGF
ncbi:MAG: DUF6048 family protein [Fulvivirga sp.]